MIRGVVTSNLEAWVDLALVSSDRHSVGFSAVIDTGFSDYLTLPMAVLETFHAIPLMDVLVTLADGSEVTSHLFELTVLWDNRHLTIEVHAAETEPLIGMALLAGHDLRMRVIADGEVSIRAISEIS